MIPHYPTSADLAAMRREIEPNRPPFSPDNQWTGPGYDDAYPPESGLRWYAYPGGAWPHEREHGIGWTMLDWPDYPYATEARGEANRLRRAAFERMAEWPNGPEAHPFRPFADAPTVCAECGAWQGDSEHAAEYYGPRPESESELRFAYGDR